MFESSLVVLVAIEIAVVLLLLCVFLLLHVRGMQRVVKALEAKVISGRDTLKATRQDAKVLRQQLHDGPQASALDYGEYVDAQIDATRNHHLSLDPDRDIVLDIAPDASLERQAVALRHAFLVAEKEAWLANDEQEIDWNVLQGKLGQIIQFYQQGSSVATADIEVANPAAADSSAADEELAKLQEALANQTRHMENLEKFKKLFFDTEQKWRDASAQAEKYHQQLLERSKAIGADESFEALLVQYGSAYSNFGAELAEDRGEARAAAHVIEVERGQPSWGSVVIANQEEMLRLRNMAIDQHKVILNLRQQLDDAQTVEQKDQAIAALRKQLERHERFLKESDICTKQLESELARMVGKNHTQEQQLRSLREQLDSGAQEVQAKLAHALVENQTLGGKLAELQSVEVNSSATSEEDFEQLRSIIEDFTQQSCEMLGALELLEQEARELREQLQSASGGAALADMAALQQQLAQAERALLSLQTQHVELEERYLELKIQQS